MTGHGDGGSHTTRFETEGGIGAFLFEEDVRIAPAAEHGSPTFTERDRRGVGEDGMVAPHAEPGMRGSVGRDLVAGGEAASGREVVADVKRTGAMGADVARDVGGGALVAAGAFEMKNLGHEGTIAAWKRAAQVGESRSLASCSGYGTRYDVAKATRFDLLRILFA